MPRTKTGMEYPAKGSAAAKEWGRKMQAARKAKKKK